MDYETILIVIAAVLVVAIGWFIGTLNRLKKYRVIINESQKNVDIALAKRYDTICQMFKVAQSFAKYEKTTLVDLVSLREGLNSADSSEAMKNQNNAIGKIYALAEAYPELKSSEQFLNLQEEVNDENEQLAASKRIVNSNISALNQNIVTFPVSFIARLSGIKQMDFLDEDDLSNKKNIDSILSQRICLVSENVQLDGISNVGNRPRICIDWLLVIDCFVQVKKIAANGKNLHQRLLDVYCL